MPLPQKHIAVLRSSAIALASGSPTVADNVTRQRYVKDVIRTGTYTHPDAGWTLTVTDERIDQWIKSAKAMRAAGVDIEVTIDHDTGADAVRGYVVDEFRVGDTLYQVLELIGTDAIALVERVKNVSIEIADNYTDGKGNEYGEVIYRTSIVQQPVVPGQAPFIRIAASKGGIETKIPIFTATQEKNVTPLIDAIKKLLGREDITETNAVDALSAWHAANKSKADETAARVASLEAEVKTLSANSPKKLSSEAMELIEERADALAEQLDALVAGSHITPAVRDSLKPILLGTEPAKRPTFMLSREGGSVPIAKTIIEALRKNSPVELARKATGGARVIKQPLTDEETKLSIDEIDKRVMAVTGRR